MFKALSSLRPKVPERIVVGGRDVAVELREHATARRIVMRIAPGGEALRLTVPKRTPARTILDFLKRHEGWAADRLSKVARTQVVGDGSVLPFRGGVLTVRREAGRRAVSFKETAEGPVLFVGGDEAHVARRVKDFLVREARRDLDAAVERHAAAVGIRPSGLALRDTVSRWGSCSSTRRLSFSWRIVMAPPAVLDYLAAHEVAHLREMNHGPNFWALCRRLCPATEEGRSWLKRHGSSLHAIDFG